MFEQGCNASLYQCLCGLREVEIDPVNRTELAEALYLWLDGIERAGKAVAVENVQYKRSMLSGLRVSVYSGILIWIPYLFLDTAVYRCAPPQITVHAYSIPCYHSARALIDIRACKEAALNTKLIRNSTAEFLIFTGQSGEQTIEARYEDDTIRLTQKLMAELFGVSTPTVNEHLKKIFQAGELADHSVIRKFLITAAELVKLRADSSRPNMGLTSWANGPEGKILKTDVATAKNYLSQDELSSLGRIVNAYLELAEDRAKRRIPMTMEDWAKRLDAFLQFDEREILQDSGNISARLARQHAESEFEKYRIVQDRLFESDFDKLVKDIDSKPTD